MDWSHRWCGLRRYEPIHRGSFCTSPIGKTSRREARYWCGNSGLSGMVTYVAGWAPGLVLEGCRHSRKKTDGDCDDSRRGNRLYFWFCHVSDDVYPWFAPRSCGTGASTEGWNHSCRSAGGILHGGTPTRGRCRGYRTMECAAHSFAAGHLHAYFLRKHGSSQTFNRGGCSRGRGDRRSLSWGRLSKRCFKPRYKRTWGERWDRRRIHRTPKGATYQPDRFDCGGPADCGKSGAVS